MMPGRFYFMPIFFNIETSEIKAKHSFFEPVLSFLIWIHMASSAILDFIGIDHDSDFPVYLYKDKNS